MLGMIPSRGKRTSGNSAVTAMAVPSPIHQQAMSAATASRRFPEGVIPSGKGMSRRTEKKISPPTSTKTWRRNVTSELANAYSGGERVFSMISQAIIILERLQPNQLPDFPTKAPWFEL